MQSQKQLERVYKMAFATVYPLYIQKAARKGRSKEEVDEVIRWLTGYDQAGLEKQIDQHVNFEEFFSQSTLLNPIRSLIKGVVFGVRVDDIEDPIMREVRYLYKLIDELAKGRPMEKILRKE